LLVDKTTTDKTVEIASRYEKVKIELVEWQGYAATKSEALALTTGDWILWIDADEALSAELCKEIKNFREKPRSDFVAYKIARRAFFLGKWIKHSGWYPGYVVRFFKKGEATFNANAVHEGLVVKGKIGTLQNDIYHFTDPTISHYFRKFNEYTSLAAKQLFAESRRFKVSDVLLRPPFLFFKMFILRKGFLDGLHGFVLAVFSSLYVFTKYLKLWELEKNEDRNNSER